MEGGIGRKARRKHRSSLLINVWLFLLGFHCRASQNCQHNTEGDHCEKCIIGHHGNATLGTPNDCMICACPMPIESNK